MLVLLVCLHALELAGNPAATLIRRRRAACYLAGMEPAVVRRPRTHELAELGRLAGPVLERAGAAEAIAFGSYARGTADGFSDLDLAVVLETELPFVERGRLLFDLHDALPVAVDVLVYTPDEMDRGLRGDRGLFAVLNDEGVRIWPPRDAP